MVTGKTCQPFQETKRPSKEMQVSIARQLGLQPTTVGNFFMNARRRLQDKWQNCDYEQNQLNGAKIDNNNESLIAAATAAAATQSIMIVEGYSPGDSLQHNPTTPGGQPHDLSFALEAIESIEQPPPPVSGSSDHATNPPCVYSLTSL